MPPGRFAPAFDPSLYDADGNYLGGTSAAPPPATDKYAAPGYIPANGEGGYTSQGDYASSPPPPPETYIPGSTYVPPEQRSGYIPPDYPDPSYDVWGGYSSATSLPFAGETPAPQQLPFTGNAPPPRPIDSIWPSWLPEFPAWIHSPNPMEYGYRMWHLPGAPLVGGTTIYEGGAPSSPSLPSPVDPPSRNSGGSAFLPGQPLPVPTWDNTSGYLGVERNRSQKTY